ncbi:MAG: hypothetical protein VCB07_07055 [Gammaproteobacteria bacterium]
MNRIRVLPPKEERKLNWSYKDIRDDAMRIPANLVYIQPVNELN